MASTWPGLSLQAVRQLARRHGYREEEVVQSPGASATMQPSLVAFRRSRDSVRANVYLAVETVGLLPMFAPAGTEEVLVPHCNIHRLDSVLANPTVFAPSLELAVASRSPTPGAIPTSPIRRPQPLSAGHGGPAAPPHAPFDGSHVGISRASRRSAPSSPAPPSPSSSSRSRTPSLAGRGTPLPAASTRVQCCACHALKAPDDFSRAQLARAGVARCWACVRDSRLPALRFCNACFLVLPLPLFPADHLHGAAATCTACAHDGVRPPAAVSPGRGRTPAPKTVTDAIAACAAAKAAADAAAVVADAAAQAAEDADAVVCAMVAGGDGRSDARRRASSGGGGGSGHRSRSRGQRRPVSGRAPQSPASRGGRPAAGAGAGAGHGRRRGGGGHPATPAAGDSGGDDDYVDDGEEEPLDAMTPPPSSVVGGYSSLPPSPGESPAEWETTLRRKPRAERRPASPPPPPPMVDDHADAVSAVSCPSSRRSSRGTRGKHRASARLEMTLQQFVDTGLHPGATTVVAFGTNRLDDRPAGDVVDVGVIITPGVGRGHVGTGSLPTGLVDLLKCRGAAPAVYVALGSGGRFYGHLEDGTSAWSTNLPASFSDVLDSRRRLPVLVAFGQVYDSYFVMFDNGRCFWNKLPRALEAKLDARNASRTGVSQLALASDGRWFVQFPDGSMSFCGAGPHDALFDNPTCNVPAGSFIRDVVFGSHGQMLVQYSTSKRKS